MEEGVRTPWFRISVFALESHMRSHPVMPSFGPVDASSNSPGTQAVKSTNAGQCSLRGIGVRGFRVSGLGGVRAEGVEMLPNVAALRP